MIIGLFAILGAASASPRAHHPAPALSLPDCAVDDDSCWLFAPTLSRFAPPRALGAEPVEGRSVRLAHQDGHLVVRAGPLPDGHHLELSITPSPDTAVSRSLPGEVGSDGVWTAPEAAPVGSIFGLRVLLVDRTAGVARPWTPVGQGDLLHALPVVLAPALPVSAPLVLDVDEQGLHLDADGASEVRIWAASPVPREPNRGLPDPWEVAGAPPLSTPGPPSRGWVTLEATWTDEAGQVSGIARGRTWLPGPDNVLADEPFLPRPAWSKPLRGQGWGLAMKVSIAASQSWQDDAQELGEVIRASTYGSPGFVDHPRKRGIHLVDSLPAEVEAPEVFEQPGAFAMVSRLGQLVVAAHDEAGRSRAVAALLSALGNQLTLPAIALADAPAITLRPLFVRWHASRSWLGEGVEPATLEQLVDRGRFSDVFVDATKSMVQGTETSSSSSFARDFHARTGVPLSPALDTPAHAEWLLGQHPELAEGVSRSMVCTRHPQTRDTLSSWATRLMTAFPDGPYVLLGFDEALWRSTRLMGDERCPRCAGTPRARLLADHLDDLATQVISAGRTPVVWSDTFVAGWNGSSQGGQHALEAVSSEVRAALHLLSWSRVGDTLGTLGTAGWKVIRGHTGYHDWRRPGLAAARDLVAGEAIALFQPDPRSAFGTAPGTRAVAHHWSRALAAGATAWEPALADEPLAHLLDWIAARPGPGASPRFGGSRMALPVSGGGEGVLQPGVVLPQRLRVGQFHFRDPVTHVATQGHPLHIETKLKPRRLALLVSAELSRDTARRLRADMRAASPLPPPIAEISFGGVARHAQPLHYGLHVFTADVGPEPVPMWFGHDTATLPSPEATALGLDATDRQLTVLLIDAPVGWSGGVKLSVLVEGAEVAVHGAVGH